MLAVAPSAISDSYSMVKHSTSESAGQLVEGAWVARTGLMTFGLAALWIAGTRSHRRLWGRAGTLAHDVFGVSMVLAATFSARAWDRSVPYDPTDDLLHSVASFGSGLGFIVGVVLVGLHRGRRRQHLRWADPGAVVAVVAMLIATSAWPHAGGVFQRVMFAAAYLWYGAESLGPTLDGVPAPSSR